MKNKYFYIRIINVLIIALCIFGYQGVASSRDKNEEIQQLKADLKTAQETITNTKEIAASIEKGEAVTVSSGSTEVEAETNDGSKTVNYKDGTYQGEAEGFGGPVKVEVTILDSRISNISVLDASKEDSAYFEMAEGLLPEIVEQQSADIDVISGATYSSNGILGGVEKALAQAVSK